MFLIILLQYKKGNTEDNMLTHFMLVKFILCISG